MANETIMQGLLESLMQRPQDTAQQRGTVLANLISQPNPIAAYAAYALPGQLENVAGAARGLFGLKAPVSPQQAIQTAVATNPNLMSDPSWLTKQAQAASAAGDNSLAMRLSLAAAQLQQTAQATTTANEARSARRMATMQQVEAALAAAPNDAARRALTGLRTAVLAGNYDDKDITAPLENILQMTKAPEQAQTGMKPNEIAQLYKDYTPESVQQFIQNPAAVLVPRTTPQKADGLAQKDIAGLYKDFTQESVQAFMRDPSAVLVPREEGGRNSTNYARQLVESGLVEGSPEFKQAMADYNKSMVQGNLRTMSPLEQVNLMNSQLNALPTVERTADNIAQLKQIKAILPAASQGKSNPQAYTLLTAILPQLVGSNSRAQAEIDAFRSRKGISESIGDWAITSLGGTASRETLQNLNEIVSILDRTFSAQRLQEVSRVAAGYKGVVPDEVLSNWQRNQLADVESDIEDIVNSALGL